MDRTMARLGITYRQFDHWSSRGYLGGPSLTGHGTGNPRMLTNDQIRVLRRMGELVNRGMTPAAASALARSETWSPEELAVMWASGRGELT